MGVTVEPVRCNGGLWWLARLDWGNGVEFTGYGRMPKRALAFAYKAAAEHLLLGGGLPATAVIMKIEEAKIRTIEG